MAPSLRRRLRKTFTEGNLGSFGQYVGQILENDYNQLTLAALEYVRDNNINGLPLEVVVNDVITAFLMTHDAYWITPDRKKEKITPSGPVMHQEYPLEWSKVTGATSNFRDHLDELINYYKGKVDERFIDSPGHM